MTSPRLMPMRRTMRLSSLRGVVGLGHFLLQFQRRLDRVHRAGEFHQHAVAHDLHDAARVAAHDRLQDGLPPLLQRGERSRLVSFHEARVADDVGNRDGGEAAFGAFIGHLDDAWSAGSADGIGAMPRCPLRSGQQHPDHCLRAGTGLRWVMGEFDTAWWKIAHVAIAGAARGVLYHPAVSMSQTLPGNFMVRSRRLELPRVAPQRPQRCASTNSATTARGRSRNEPAAACSKSLPAKQALLRAAAPAPAARSCSKGRDGAVPPHPDVLRTCWPNPTFVHCGAAHRCGSRISERALANLNLDVSA